MTNFTNSSSSGSEEESNLKVKYVVLACLFCFGAAADCFLIFIVRMTPTFESTGYLITNQLVSDIGKYITSFLMIVPRLLDKQDIIDGTGYMIRCQLIQVFRGITSHTLSAGSLNLYFAICHSAEYRVRMSLRYIYVFVPLCWVFNLLLCTIPLIDKKTRKSLYIPQSVTLLPIYNTHSTWVWVLVMINVYVVPAVITAFVFIEINRYSHKIQPNKNTNINYRDKYRLSKVITGISVWYIGMWSLLHLFRSLQARYEANYEEHEIFQNLSLTAYLVNLAYDTFKVVLYIWIYKPIRDTTLQRFRCSQAEAVE